MPCSDQGKAASESGSRAWRRRGRIQKDAPPFEFLNHEIRQQQDVHAHLTTAGIRRHLAFIAVVVAGIVLVELLGFNRYFIEYSLLRLQPQRLPIHRGLLHDFEVVNDKLLALSDDPNITFEHVDGRVQRIALSCKNARPGALGRVYFMAGNGPVNDASSVSYSTGRSLYNRVVDLPVVQVVTALTFDLTNIKGDRVACGDILLNPSVAFHVTRLRLALYACALLGALAAMWRRQLRSASSMTASRLWRLAGALVPREISRAQAIMIVTLALAAGGTAYWRASTLDPVIYWVGSGVGFGPGYRLTDMWFNADISKIVAMASDPGTFQAFVTSEHPLILLAMYPPVTILRAAGLTLLEAVRAYWAIIAALWTAMLFILLRAIGCRPADATLLTVMAMTSAAFVFWFAVPEAFSLGSLAILVVLYLASVAHRTKPHLGFYIVINLVSLSITLTNWMVGILASILNLPWRRAFLVIAGEFLLTIPLWGIEKLAFPATSFFLGSTGRLNEYMHIPPTAGRIFEVVPSFFVDTMVMPRIIVYDRRPFQRVMTTDGTIPGSGSPAGYLAAAAWLALLGLGGWACFSVWKESSLIRHVVLTTAGQLALNFVFGAESFLYSMHFLPLLILIAANVMRTRWRTVGLGLAVVIAVTCVINTRRNLTLQRNSSEPWAGWPPDHDLWG